MEPETKNKLGFYPALTFGDNSFQMNDVVVTELSHDARLAQEVNALLFGVTRFQRLYGHRDLLLATFQNAFINFAKFS